MLSFDVHYKRDIIHIFRNQGRRYVYNHQKHSASNGNLFFVYIAHASTHPSSYYHQGTGGDARATVIHDNWRHGTPDLVNLTDIP